MEVFDGDFPDHSIYNNFFWKFSRRFWDFGSFFGTTHSRTTMTRKENLVNRAINYLKFELKKKTGKILDVGTCNKCRFLLRAFTCY